MKKISILHEGHIYKNPYPGFQVVSALYSALVPFSNDEILSLSRIGQALYSHDGKILIQRSMDGGASWEDEGFMELDIPDADQYRIANMHPTLLGDGRLVCLACCYKTRPEIKVGVHAVLTYTEWWLGKSNDKGKTWCDFHPVPMEFEGVDVPSSIIEISSDRWFMPIEHWRGWNEGERLSIKGHALFSSDQGKTWGERVDYPSAADPEIIYSHSRYSKMKDGRLCALQWPQKDAGQKNLELHIVFSDPSGREWTRPRPTGLNGQTCWLSDLGEGLMIAVYSCRETMKPGVIVALSYDEGKTWDVGNQIYVWDAVGQEFLGVDHPPEYPQSHDNIAFGMPRMTILPCGEVIVSWWCTQACITHSRYARLKID